MWGSQLSVGKTAGPNLTRQGLINAIQTKASSFRSKAAWTCRTGLYAIRSASRSTSCCIWTDGMDDGRSPRSCGSSGTRRTRIAISARSWEGRWTPAGEEAASVG